MFARFSASEFPFSYLLSINYGNCRFCNFEGGDMTTQAKIVELQNHYLANHPVTKHQHYWTQQMSGNPADFIKIAKFGIDDCNQDDCSFSRGDRNKQKK